MAEIRAEPLGYPALDEIGKGYSKAMVDVNAYLISQRDKPDADKLPTSLLSQKKSSYKFDMMNFVVQNNLVKHDNTPEVVTPFTIN